MSQERATDRDQTHLPAGHPGSTRLWLTPAVMLGAFLLVFGLIIWFIEGNNKRAKQSDLNARAKTFSGSLQLTLEGNASYLAMLALERSLGKLDRELFQQRAAHYVRAHPELINITWVDAQYFIRDAAPLAPNRQIIGLQLNLPEPKRVSRLARELRRPVYTRPFLAIQGKPSFEIWVPVYRDGTFLGLFGGVYSCEKLLEQLTLQTRPRLYHLTLLDAQGALLAGTPPQDPLDKELHQEVPVTPIDSGVALRVSRYQGGRDWRLTLLKLASLALVFGMAHTLRKLRREIEERKLAEEALQRQALLLEQEAAERQDAQEHLQEQAAQLEEEIAERRQAQEALRESEEKLRLLLDSTGEAIYGIDQEGRCTFCNSALLRMLGYREPAQLLGEDMHERMHHSHPDGSKMPRESCMVYRTLLEPSGCHVENEVFWRADGSSFPVEYWSYPQVKQGKVVGAVVAFIDITQRKRLEEQFRQSQKMESIGRLAGGVAHDFNNMLSVILGSVELCKRRLEDGEPVEQYLELIGNAARRSGDITRQLLAFSRNEVISPKPVDLNLQISESCKMLARLIGEEVKLDFRPAERLWSVLIDPTQLDQVLMNLAANARDAMPQGGELVIETANVQLTGASPLPHPDAGVGDYVLLTVSDNGQGMDKSTLEHIFEPFFTTKEPGRGTGLGLATVYGIVTQNNGYINVDSEPGRGTLFRIYLPRHEQKVRASEAPPPEPRPFSGTVLLVEDEQMLLWVTTRLLEEMGFSVLQAQTPGRAIALCRDRDQRIDLILTDVAMPEMNGREMIRRINEFRPGLKVLFMSGHTSDSVLQRGIVDQGMQYIQKPLDMQTLSVKIRQVLAEQ